MKKTDSSHGLHSFQQDKASSRRAFRCFLYRLSVLYITAVGSWSVLYLYFGDRWRWLFILNTFSVYLFFPLPLLLLLAFLVRRRVVWIGTAGVLALAGYLYGDLFIPRPARTAPSRQTLTVMSYNVLGFNQHTAPMLRALQAADADVVALQELCPAKALAIRDELSATYPYQMLQPRPGGPGKGVISRYPISPIEITLPGNWVGPPQIVELAFYGNTITLLNFHAIRPGLYEWSSFKECSRARDQEARAIVELARSRPGPFLALGDLNAGDRNILYTFITRQLVDAWREGGWGLGNTFSGASGAHEFDLPIASILGTVWLVRIDYIFHSRNFQTEKAWVGPDNGDSDHRPVLARLTLAGKQ